MRAASKSPSWCTSHRRVSGWKQNARRTAATDRRSPRAAAAAASAASCRFVSSASLASGRAKRPAAIRSRCSWKKRRDAAKFGVQEYRHPPQLSFWILSPFIRRRRRGGGEGAHVVVVSSRQIGGVELVQHPQPRLRVLCRGVGGKVIAQEQKKNNFKKQGTPRARGSLTHLGCVFQLLQVTLPFACPRASGGVTHRTSETPSLPLPSRKPAAVEG
jgi:hypothetical protein